MWKHQGTEKFKNQKVDRVGKRVQAAEWKYYSLKSAEKVTLAQKDARYLGRGGGFDFAL